MSSKYKPADSRAIIELLRPQISEDPNRKPHEKESAFHLEGDATHVSVTSFKKVIYMKLLRQSEFSVKQLHVLDEDGQEYMVDSLDEVIATPSLTIIGVVGNLPVGAMSIGKARNSNTHANIVK
jgi:hypothetical protein